MEGYYSGYGWDAIPVRIGVDEMITLTNTIKLLQELKEALYQVYGERLCGLYLYGSFASQDQDTESDVDIAIVLKEFRDYWEEIQRTGSIVSELSLKYDVSISPIRIREMDWVQEDSPFLNNVRKECIAL